MANIAQCQAIESCMVGSESSKRGVNTLLLLSQYTSTQFMMCREDVFKASLYAMTMAPPEAVAGLNIYARLSEMSSGGMPGHLSAMATDKAKALVKSLAEGSKLTGSADRDLAKKLFDHLSKVSAE